MMNHFSISVSLTEVALYALSIILVYILITPGLGERRQYNTLREIFPVVGFRDG